MFFINIRITIPDESLKWLKPQVVDSRIGTTQHSSGYDWLEELHLKCPGDSFVAARLSAKILRKNRTATEHFLNKERCTSIFALHFPDGKVHSVCVLKDPSYSYVARDSGQLVRNPESRFDARGATLEQLFFNLYNIEGIIIGESMLIMPLSSSLPFLR